MKTMIQLRKIKGWNQTMLAEAAGLEQSTISKIENGWDGTTLRSLKLIAQALNVPVHQLFVDNGVQTEIMLLEVFRSLPEDRQQGWIDMAHGVKAERKTDDQ